MQVQNDYNSANGSPMGFPTYSMSMNFQPQSHHHGHHHPQQQHQQQQPQQHFSLSSLTAASSQHQMYDPESSGGSSSSMVQRRRSGGSASGGSSSNRRLSPDAMIPLDAPTQPRRYLTPSVTSRKDVPAFFTKRASYGGNSRFSDEEEDELADEPPLAPNATDQERIQWKRRQNTLAARRSRKRKLMQQQALEETAEGLARERDVWKTRAETLRRLLISNGIICPDFED